MEECPGGEDALGPQLSTALHTYSVSNADVVVGHIPNVKCLVSVPEFAEGSDKSLSSVPPPCSVS